jgi:uncharacterized membrane protein YciS (DUF1049 family)
MKKITLFFLMLLPLLSFTQTEKFIQASVGFGVSFYENDADVSANGFFLQGEYVFKFSQLLELRPYVGFILTKAVEPENEINKNYSVSTNAFFLGGKARLTIPIPFVAPYIELGIGTSLGKFQMETLEHSFNDRGVAYHIPITLGLKLGQNRDFDFAFAYLLHNSKHQIAGAMAVGFTFPISKK